LLAGLVGVERADLGDQRDVPVDGVGPVLAGRGGAVLQRPAGGVGRPPAGDELVPGHGGDQGAPA
jgi:hypothetical protein